VFACDFGESRPNRTGGAFGAGGFHSVPVPLSHRQRNKGLRDDIFMTRSRSNIRGTPIDRRDATRVRNRRINDRFDKRGKTSLAEIVSLRWKTADELRSTVAAVRTPRPEFGHYDPLLVRL